MTTLRPREDLHCFFLKCGQFNPSKRAALSFVAPLVEQCILDVDLRKKTKIRCTQVSAWSASNMTNSSTDGCGSSESQLSVLEGSPTLLSVPKDGP